jgi:hypothetical protein
MLGRSGLDTRAAAGLQQHGLDGPGAAAPEAQLVAAQAELRGDRILRSNARSACERAVARGGESGRAR